jgi:hypothetical protein
VKIVTLAAGVAVGYVLGSRAGREKYEQIVATVQRMSGRTGVVPAQNSAEETLIGDPAAPSPDEAASATSSPPAAARPPRPRRKPVTPAPGIAAAPLM